MASVKVAVRVRPFNEKEKAQNSERIIAMDGKKTKIINTKVNQLMHNSEQGDQEYKKEFSFDYSYWSFDHKDANYISQEQVFNDLGTDVVNNAFKGYNACLFAYGQTGSGKTFTMMGSDESLGLIPRICQSLFNKMDKSNFQETTYRTEISYLEIYNEKVKDLLIPSQNSIRNLRVREHPQSGPFVENLSNHLVTQYQDIWDLIQLGNSRRSTASTNMNDTSSRSHTIFTIKFVQAKFHHETPSETVSKINLVDLAGSERAHANGVVGDRLKEGCYINTSLVTLGVVISALADRASVKNRSQPTYIPYRNSVLTWLLKDSLGGNSKTIMIATISPSHLYYGETISTLRYANRAKNIRNNPTVNEDPKVKLIRELRAEIARLKNELKSNKVGDCNLVSELKANEVKVRALTEEWEEQWAEAKHILEEQKTLALRKSGVGVILDSDQPHLVGINDSLYSTGITFYPLKEGFNYIGSELTSFNGENVGSGDNNKSEYLCEINLNSGEAWINPLNDILCYIDSTLVNSPTILTHGCVIVLGRYTFRFNDPEKAAILRNQSPKEKSDFNLSRLGNMSWSSPNLAKSLENLSHRKFNSPIKGAATSVLDLNESQLSYQESFIANQMRTDKNLMRCESGFDEEFTNSHDIQRNRLNFSSMHSICDSESKNNETTSEKNQHDGEHILQISPENNMNHLSETNSICSLNKTTKTKDFNDPRASPLTLPYETKYDVSINTSIEDLHKMHVALDNIYEEIQSNVHCDVQQRMEQFYVLKKQFKLIENELQSYNDQSPTSPSSEFFCNQDRRSNMKTTPLSVVSLTDDKKRDSYGADSSYSSSSVPSSRYSFCMENDILEENEISISIPSYVLRGSGFKTHYEYEIKISVKYETWTILRRFQRFRELHEYMKKKYGSDLVKNVRFPRISLFNRRSETLAEKRRQRLEIYLHDLLAVCLSNKVCHLYAYSDELTQDLMCEIIPFFKKGHFETTKFETG